VIALRPFEDADAALLQKWLYSPHVAKWYKYPGHWLREIRRRHGEFSFITHFIAVFDGVPIGFCQYYDTHFAQEHEVWNDEPQISQVKGEIYSIDYLIGEAAYLRKGYGKTIVGLLCEEVRGVGAKRIIADPEPGNAASSKTLEANGFTHDGSYYSLNLGPIEAP
jgi:RimJ/RimL family protein N-acetyltransferase